MKRLILTIQVTLFCVVMMAQSKYIYSGTVVDAGSGEKVFGANIFIENTNVGTTSNEYGYYSLELPEGKYRLTISCVGYDIENRVVSVSENKKLDFRLKESSYMLDEVSVVASSQKADIRSPQMSVTTMSVNTIQSTPVVLGEVDVVKSLLQMPGVTNAGEGAGDFNVRGGAADQNLVLLDEAPLFSSSHLFGFFSVFNAEAIRSLKLYKGGIPARYGGRVASVLDVYQKDGNKNQFHMSGGIGALSSNLMLEGPIRKSKSSFLLAGRSSYAHLFLKLSDNDNMAYFYDLNTKLNFQLNEKNSLYLSGYFGRDVFSLGGNLKNVYGNALGNLRWNHLFSDKLFSNLSVIYSDYYYNLLLDLVGFEWSSGIRNYHLKYDLNYYLTDKITLKYGVHGAYLELNPGKINASNEISTLRDDEVGQKNAFESAAYIDVQHELTEKLTLSYGLRYSSFLRLGREKVAYYQDNLPVVFNEDLQLYENASPVLVRNYDRWHKIKAYNNLEPRFSVSYVLGANSSLKASFNRMAQYMHLLSNTSSPTPFDVWTPSGKYIKPQLLNQYALGYVKNFSNDVFSLELEGYYKTLENRIDYISGADLLGNKAIEQVILPAEGRAYGFELLFKKNKGKFTGWLAYTIARSEQQVKPRNNRELGINNGEWYRTPYDKTHDLSIVGIYRLGNKWSVSASFSFQSGLPTTYPQSKYEYEGLSIPNYGLRNKEELPSYHRLDFSVTYAPRRNSKKRWKGEWCFGVYNLYNRMNARSITFRQDEVTGRNEAVKLSIFGIVPSVTYKFKF